MRDQQRQSQLRLCHLASSAHQAYPVVAVADCSRTEPWPSVGQLVTSIEPLATSTIEHSLLDSDSTAAEHCPLAVEHSALPVPLVAAVTVDWM